MSDSVFISMMIIISLVLIYISYVQRKKSIDKFRKNVEFISVVDEYHYISLETSNIKILEQIRSELISKLKLDLSSDDIFYLKMIILSIENKIENLKKR